MHDEPTNGEHRRDPRGRFAAGNPGGPGRPKKEPPKPDDAEPRPWELMSGMHLWALANVLQARKEIIARIEQECDPDVVAQIHALIRASDRLAGLRPLED